MTVIQITYWCIVLCALVLQSTKDSTKTLSLTVLVLEQKGKPLNNKLYSCMHIYTYQDTR